MKLLLIDDKPDYRSEKIKEAVKQTALGIEVKTLNDNREESVKSAIKDIDLIVLDWYFPEGYPNGEETLNLIRKLGFSGPILIYTVGFQPFDRYIGRGKANDYFWEAWGIDSLAHTLQRLIAEIRQADRDQVIKWPGERAEFIYYSSYLEMKSHFYHPDSTNDVVSESEREKSRRQALFVTCEWVEEKIETRSGVMGQVIRDIERLAETNIPVLILGDTGTGKELVGKLLHFHHKNKGRRYDFEEKSKKDYYMALNCGAFTEAGTLNVELFGSLPGAFTDATEKAGIFEQVTEYDNGNAINGGTVFLDEVGLMELPDQAFLLRVLQENNVYRMGHDERKAGKDKVKIKIARELIESRLFGKIPVKFRLVAATNEDLLENTKRGDFRLDLFYRIARAIIKLPPLRNRSKRDFNLLFQYFLHRFNKEHGRNVTLSNSGGFVVPPSSDLIEHLWATFPWRGNVRELEGLVDTIVALSASDRSEPLGLRDIPEFHWQKQEVFERKE